MMKYFTDFNRAPSIPQPTGSELAPVYKFRTDKNGERKIVKVKETNVYSKIQAGKSSCDIENIIKRYGIDLNKDIASFENEVVDLTIEPGSLNEAHQMIERAQEIFESAPNEIKQIYNQSFGKFVKAVGTGEISKDLKNLKKEKTILQGQIEMPQTQTTQPAVQQQEMAAQSQTNQKPNEGVTIYE